MTVKAYVKAGGKVREIKGLFAKKNGKVVRVKEIYVGRNGTKQLIFQAPTAPFPKLEITTGSDIALGNKDALPRAKYYEEYNARIKATGGDGCYVFSVNTGHLFKGLELKPDGTMCGIPVDGGMSSLYYRVTDGSGNTATKRLAIRVSAIIVNFEIRGNYIMYDGKPHTVTQAIPSDERITDDDFTVTVGGAETQVNAGNYDIEIKINKRGFRLGGISPRMFRIGSNDSSKISLSSKTVKYDGQPHALIPIVEPAEIKNAYKVTYTGKNGTVYEKSEQPPTAVGVYTVNAETTNKNYVIRTATATLTITE